MPAPRLLAISPPDPTAALAWLDLAPALIGAGADGLLLRVVGEGLDPACLERLQGCGVPVLVHRRSEALWPAALELGLGLHLPAGLDPAPWRARVRGLLGQSCHDEGELRRAAGGCDYATFSPVFAPFSRPGDRRPPLGIEGLRRGCTAVALPVLALGGIGPAQAGACLAAGAWGLAGIGACADPARVRDLALASPP